MKCCAYVLMAASLAAAPATKTFVGVIHDNRCFGPNCATQCPVKKTSVYTLQAGDQAFLLSDQKSPARFTGRMVIVTGTVEPDNKLKVVSIVPASASSK
jgi:hypothetical protein